MYFKKTKFLIVGLLRSGYSACLALLKRNAECYIYDADINAVVKSNIDTLCLKGAILANGENIENVIELCDVVVLSPGVPIDNQIPIIARRLKKNIIGELELGYYLTNSPIVAVTGTNGKTTTCSLINHLLSKSSINSYLAGNIGIPLCEQCDKYNEDSVAVVEVSSFQLESIAFFAPHIACVLNIAPDHLTRHYNMDNYLYLKKRILKNLRESEYAVLNADDEQVSSFAKDTRAKIIYFSLTKRVDGAYFSDNKLFWKGEEIISADELSLSGGHNIQNALASICVCKILGIEKQLIIDGLKDFKGVKHRIQLVGENLGVKYYNDSKATNPLATLSAIKAVKGDIHLLIGGRDKGEGYEQLFATLEANDKIKSVILYGESGEKLYHICKKHYKKEVNLLHKFDSAVKFAQIIAKTGENILLSPACSSFDEFSGFEQRGDRFIQIISQNQRTNKGENQ